MSLVIYNTLSRKNEEFKPLIDKKVSMYVCGPTVYNYIHVGNARPMVFFDVVVRYLKYKGYEVTYVRNITDVDDKIINRSKEEKKDASSIAQIYTNAFEEDMQALGLNAPTVSPKATEHIPRMIEWIQTLIEKQFAYVVNGEVLYSIDKIQKYGVLSKKNKDDLIAGARVEISQHKRNPMDFVLWKPSKPGEPNWDSPWGKGRPGWHMECSVMSTQYLGETFDIHGGGIDLIFPHHENEIAQSEAVTGKPFVKYWMHNEMLSFGKEKMSKSLGNIITAHDFLKDYPAEVLKFILLSNHYRSTIEFSDQTIRESILSLEKIYSTLSQVESRLKKEIPKEDETTASNVKDHLDPELEPVIQKFIKKFEEAMDDDFNTTKALGLIFDVVRVVNRYLTSVNIDGPKAQKLLTEFLKHFKTVHSIWGLFGEEPNVFLETLKHKLLQKKDLTVKEIEKCIAERLEARNRKDFKKSDEIRKYLLDHHIQLEDSPSGTTWKVQK